MAHMSVVYPFRQWPASGEYLEIAPGVRWLRMSLPFQLDHVNLWLIDAGDSWCAVDTGFADDRTRAAWESILCGLDKPIGQLIATHFHPDHLGLATWLQARTGATLAMTLGEFLTAHAVWNEVGGHGARFMSDQFAEHGLAPTMVEKFRTRGSGYRAAVPALPQHYERLRDGKVLTLGAYRWHVIDGYGHSPEHAALHCPELNLLISGDMLLPRISTNVSVFAATPDDDGLGRFLASLARMRRELPPETLVLPAHGLPFTGLATRIDELEAHHADRLELLVSACDQSMTAAELMTVLFPRSLDAHQTMFALGETIAHLNHLQQAGRLRSERDAGGTIHFMRKA